MYLEVQMGKIAVDVLRKNIQEYKKDWRAVYGFDWNDCSKEVLHQYDPIITSLRETAKLYRHFKQIR